MKHHSSKLVLLIPEKENISRRVVWLGRHPAEKISAGPKGQLRKFGNLP
jgi:hypothetical protein